MVRAAALFYPRAQRSPKGAQARGGARGHGPPPVGKQHGLYVVDVGDGEHRPVSGHGHGRMDMGMGMGMCMCMCMGMGMYMHMYMYL